MRGCIINLGAASSLGAESCGLRDGLILAPELGVEALIAELDATAVIDLLEYLNHENLLRMQGTRERLSDVSDAARVQGAQQSR